MLDMLFYFQNCNHASQEKVTHRCWASWNQLGRPEQLLQGPQHNGPWEDRNKDEKKSPLEQVCLETKALGLSPWFADPSFLYFLSGPTLASFCLFSFFSPSGIHSDCMDPSLQLYRLDHHHGPSSFVDWFWVICHWRRSITGALRLNPRTPRIEPRAAGREARGLPQCWKKL